MMIKLVDEEKKEKAKEKARKIAGKYPFVDKEEYVEMFVKIPDRVAGLIGEKVLDQLSEEEFRSVKREIVRIASDIYSLRLTLQEMLYERKKRKDTQKLFT